jgi:hypothetical protein
VVSKVGPAYLNRRITNLFVFDSMTRILLALCASVIALNSVSCCCTGESEAPPLRPLTKFNEIETTTPAPAPVQVHAEK